MRIEEYFTLVFLKNKARREREKMDEMNNPAYITDTVIEELEERLKSVDVSLSSDELRDIYLPKLIKKRGDSYKEAGEKLKSIEEVFDNEIRIAYREAVNKLGYTRENEEILLEGLRSLSQP